MALSPATVAALAQNAGLSHIAAVTAVAIAAAESGLNPDAVGDVALEDATWGPSVGLWQIRSLRAQAGTGGPRDETRLKDPAFNARSMAEISGQGHSWGAWSTYNDGAYRAHLGLVTASVGGGTSGGTSGGTTPTLGGLPAGYTAASGTVVNGTIAPTPSGTKTVPSGTGVNTGWDPLGGAAGAVGGAAGDLFGWATGKVANDLWNTAFSGIVASVAFGLGVTLIAVGAYRAVT